MYKQVITIMLLLALSIIINNFAKAADVTQKLTAPLSIYQAVYAWNGNLHTTIDCVSGDLAAALTPRFIIYTNQPGTGARTWSVYAEVVDSTLTNRRALYYDTGESSVHIVLANEAIKPTVGAINDIINGTLSSNPNVISYPASLVLGAGTLNITSSNFVSSQQYYRIKSQGGGYKIINLNTGTVPRPSTFSAADADGQYCATVWVQAGTP